MNDDPENIEAFLPSPRQESGSPSAAAFGGPLRGMPAGTPIGTSATAGVKQTSAAITDETRNVEEID
jgi:hypothetical protein